MQRSAFTIIQLLLVLVAVVIIAAVVWPIFARPKECCMAPTTSPATGITVA